MKIIVIACINYNNAIGWKESNSLIFHISGELQAFKKLTSDTIDGKSNIVVMGSNTWNSLPRKPLMNRMNCVISSKYVKYNEENKGYKNFQSFPTLQHFMNFAKDNQSIYNDIYVIGGSSIYQYFLQNNLVDYLYLSKIDTPNDFGDIFFPKVDYSLFEEIYKESFRDINAISSKENTNTIINYTFKKLKYKGNSHWH